ncbi:MAG: OsmC family protein [Flavobacteriales bacterium]|nr:OsmC family protein [Flavobacteriales bacterium]
MKIKVHRENDKFHFRAHNESGNTIDMDANPAIGGEGKGARPMELLLAALGGCSGIDVVSILQKQRQVASDIDIEIHGEREAGKEPSLFKSIEVIFRLQGELDADKVKRAVELSMDKYCSVAKTLEPTASIRYRIEVNGAGL